MSRPAASSAFYVMGRNVTMQRKAWIWVSKWHSRMYRLFCQTGFAASCLLPSLSAKGAALHAPMTLIMMQNMAFHDAKGGFSQCERRPFAFWNMAFRTVGMRFSHEEDGYFVHRLRVCGITVRDTEHYVCTHFLAFFSPPCFYFQIPRYFKGLRKTKWKDFLENGNNMKLRVIIPF